ncbi:MAG: hypothetical protein ACTSQY_09485 [Candidatus Odinarchaeia archaeon]
MTVQEKIGVKAYDNSESRPNKNDFSSMDSYFDALKIHRQTQDALNDEFKSDLEKEFDVKDNPKKDKLFELAWKYGRVYGYQEVYNYYSDLVVLIQ